METERNYPSRCMDGKWELFLTPTYTVFTVIEREEDKLLAVGEFEQWPRLFCCSDILCKQ